MQGRYESPTEKTNLTDMVKFVILIIPALAQESGTNLSYKAKLEPILCSNTQPFVTMATGSVCDKYNWYLQSNSLTL